MTLIFTILQKDLECHPPHFYMCLKKSQLAKIMLIKLFATIFPIVTYSPLHTQSNLSTVLKTLQILTNSSENAIILKKILI